MRKDRMFHEMRSISFETNINLHAEGSCFVKFGNTHVICTATIEQKTAPWLKNSGKGWVTAEYEMPRRVTYTNTEMPFGENSGARFGIAYLHFNFTKRK